MDFIEQLQRRAGITPKPIQVLVEAAIDRYMQMFQQFEKLLPGVFTTDIKMNLNWAMTILKRNDRIVWYLRWVRPMIIGNGIYRGYKIEDNPLRHEIDKKLEQWCKKEWINLGKRVGLSEQQASNASESAYSNRFRSNIEHFLSLQLPKMDQIVWDKQTPEQLLGEMSEVEKEWQESVSDEKRALIATEKGDYDSPEVIIQFPDGFAWWNLNVPYCHQEGDSMGHCGNSAARKGTLLSLRKRIQKGGRQMDVPFLTFILQKDGYLGEMKGRNNKKPAERYHPYIVELLKKTDLIKGIRGGGYAPDQNFSLSDLDSETRAELEKINPNLIPLSSRIYRDGPTQELLGLLQVQAQEVGVWNSDCEFIVADPKVPDEERYDAAHPIRNQLRRSQVIVYEYSNLKQLCSYEGLENAETACEMLDDTENINYTIDQNDWEDIIEALPTEYQLMVLKGMGLNPKYGRRAIKLAADHIQQSPHFEQLELASRRAQGLAGLNLNDSATRKELLEYIQVYVYAIAWNINEVYISVDWENPDKPVKLLTSLSNFMNIVEAGVEQDEDTDEWYSYQYASDGNHGWSSSEPYNTNDRISEYKKGYGDDKEKELLDKWDPIVKAYEKKESVDLDPKDVAMEFVRIIDYQIDTIEKSDITSFLHEMRRRAGIR